MSAREIEIGDRRTTNEAHSQNNLHAFWVNVPEDESAIAGVGALEHMIRVGAMFVIPADRFDTSTYSKTGDDPTAFYYENHSGGIGVAKSCSRCGNLRWRKGLRLLAIANAHRDARIALSQPSPTT